MPMNHRERVKRAIVFQQPDRLPVWLFNQDERQGDVLWYDFRISEGVRDAQGYHGGNISEWGYVWESLDDGTMGQPSEPVIKEWKDLPDYRFPAVNEKKRLQGLDEFLEKSGEYYRLAMMIITGFTVYSFLRGFENTMMDFILEPENAAGLLDGIFEFESRLVTLAAQSGFDGFHFGDDWGTQDSLIISPEMWRKIFKPRYQKIFDHVHQSGMHVWFHSCGKVEEIVPDLHEIGVDVMNIAQPNVNDIEKVAGAYKGKQCFLMPISYQTVSISGNPESIQKEGDRIKRLFSAENGGLIGYIEEYGCVGMTEENFTACKKAFGIV